MKRVFFILLVCAAFSFLVHLFVKTVRAQSDVSGYFTCDSFCNTTLSPGCQSDYRVPDLCVGQEGNCCRILAENNIGGSCDAMGCSCTAWYHDCVIASTTPTPAPVCDTGWTCLQTGTSSACDFYNGDFTPCYISPGINGDCCRPPEQPLNACTSSGYYCRPPEQQTTPGSCEWNETSIAANCTGYPDGTLCCDSISSISSCNGDLNGACRETCDGTESPSTTVNDCQDPIQYPPSGWSCCVLSSTVPYGGPDVFCDNNGDPTNIVTGRIYTAIGCIPMTTTGDFTAFLLRWGMGIAGGVALILIVYAGILIITSGGNPQKLQAGKELLTAAITGVFLLVFGAFVLDFIGVDILRIPGFGQ